MSARPIDSMSIALDRLRAAVENYLAVLSDVVDVDSNLEVVTDEPMPVLEMEAES